jgi:hypothetical protein
MDKITVEAINLELAARVFEIQNEPEFHWTSEPDCAIDSDGIPLIKTAIGNVPLQYDLWAGLRNPAVVGMYPAGLPELWEFHAKRRRQKLDEAGRLTIFRIPRSFEFAEKNYRRAIIISVMLPFSPIVVHDYISQVLEMRKNSSFIFARSYERLNRILDRAVTKVAISLVTDDPERAVIVMHNGNAKAVSAEVIPQTRQGISHGPSKGGNYPQNSLAVLMGLGQFGVSRMVFRDELIDGRVERLAGPVRSMVIFDKEPLVTDCKEGIIYPSPAWREFLFQLFDFTNTDVNVNKYRFCSHISQDSQSCSQCIINCPSGAQENSSPKSDGHYPEQVARQTHRFWDKKLQFDFGNCIDERGNMAGLFSAWSCGRCLAVCLDRGIRRESAVESYYNKMKELARLT